MSSALLLLLRSPGATSTKSVVELSSFWEFALLLLTKLGEDSCDSFPCCGPQQVWFTQLPVFLGQSRTQFASSSCILLNCCLFVVEKEGEGERKNDNQSNEMQRSQWGDGVTSFSRSTNSGCIVVECMPSLWKNSFTFSAICM